MNKKVLKESIRRMVKEALQDLMENHRFTKARTHVSDILKKDDDERLKYNKELSYKLFPNKTSRNRKEKQELTEHYSFFNMITEDDNQSDIGSKRNFIMSVLKHNDNDKYDHAHLAYQLWPNMSKDAARSYFSKCVRGERDFSDNDITRLFNMLRSK